MFLKPFMKEQTAEFCSVCHKVHLDVPVNGYRWIRGFNEYDNWQASGVSFQGASSFYYPPKAQAMRRLPHADGEVRRLRQYRRLGSFALLPGSEHRGPVQQTRILCSSS